MPQTIVAEQGLDFVICGLCGGQFRAISNSHLVRKHHFDPENPIRTYLDRFGLREAACVETREQQKESYREHLDIHGKAWDAERVVRAIRALRDAGEPLNSREVSRAHQQLILSARRFHGSWDRALEAAGLDAGQVRLTQRWNPETILSRIRELAEHNPALTASGRAAGDAPLVQAARRAFGNWRNALRAAGLEIHEEPQPLDEPAAREPRFRWTSEQILARIRAMHAAGESLQPREVARRHGGLWHATRREFGGWALAVQACGLPYEHARRASRPGGMSSLPQAPSFTSVSA